MAFREQAPGAGMTRASKYTIGGKEPMHHTSTSGNTAEGPNTNTKRTKKCFQAALYQHPFGVKKKWVLHHQSSSTPSSIYLGGSLNVVHGRIVQLLLYIRGPVGAATETSMESGGGWLMLVVVMVVGTGRVVKHQSFLHQHLLILAHRTGERCP